MKWKVWISIIVISCALLLVLILAFFSKGSTEIEISNYERLKDYTFKITLLLVNDKNEYEYGLDAPYIILEGIESGEYKIQLKTENGIVLFSDEMLIGNGFFDFKDKKSEIEIPEINTVANASVRITDNNLIIKWENNSSLDDLSYELYINGVNIKRDITLSQAGFSISELAEYVDFNDKNDLRISSYIGDDFLMSCDLDFEVKSGISNIILMKINDISDDLVVLWDNKWIKPDRFDVFVNGIRLGNSTDTVFMINEDLRNYFKAVSKNLFVIRGYLGNKQISEGEIFLNLYEGITELDDPVYNSGFFNFSWKDKGFISPENYIVKIDDEEVGTTSDNKYSISQEELFEYIKNDRKIKFEVDYKMFGNIYKGYDEEFVFNVLKINIQNNFEEYINTADLLVKTEVREYVPEKEENAWFLITYGNELSDPEVYYDGVRVSYFIIEKDESGKYDISIDNPTIIKNFEYKIEEGIIKLFWSNEGWYGEYEREFYLNDVLLPGLVKNKKSMEIDLSGKNLNYDFEAENEFKIKTFIKDRLYTEKSFFISKLCSVENIQLSITKDDLIIEFNPEGEIIPGEYLWTINGKGFEFKGQKAIIPFESLSLYKSGLSEIPLEIQLKAYWKDIEVFDFETKINVYRLDFILDTEYLSSGLDYRLEVNGEIREFDDNTVSIVYKYDHIPEVNFYLEGSLLYEEMLKSKVLSQTYKIKFPDFAEIADTNLRISEDLIIMSWDISKKRIIPDYYKIEFDDKEATTTEREFICKYNPDAVNFTVTPVYFNGYSYYSQNITKIKAPVLNIELADKTYENIVFINYTYESSEKCSLTYSVNEGECEEVKTEKWFPVFLEESGKNTIWIKIQDGIGQMDQKEFQIDYVALPKLSIEEICFNEDSLGISWTGDKEYEEYRLIVNTDDSIEREYTADGTSLLLNFNPDNEQEFIISLFACVENTCLLKDQQRVNYKSEDFDDYAEFELEEKSSKFNCTLMLKNDFEISEADIKIYDSKGELISGKNRPINDESEVKFFWETIPGEIYTVITQLNLKKYSGGLTKNYKVSKAVKAVAKLNSSGIDKAFQISESEIFLKSKYSGKNVSYIWEINFDSDARVFRINGEEAIFSIPKEYMDEDNALHISLIISHSINGKEYEYKTSIYTSNANKYLYGKILDDTFIDTKGGKIFISDDLYIEPNCELIIDNSILKVSEGKSIVSNIGALTFRNCKISGIDNKNWYGIDSVNSGLIIERSGLSNFNKINTYNSTLDLRDTDITEFETGIKSYESDIDIENTYFSNGVDGVNGYGDSLININNTTFENIVNAVSIAACKNLDMKNNKFIEILNAAVNLVECEFDLTSLFMEKIENGYDIRLSRGSITNSSIKNSKFGILSPQSEVTIKNFVITESDNGLFFYNSYFILSESEIFTKSVGVQCVTSPAIREENSSHFSDKYVLNKEYVFSGEIEKTTLDSEVAFSLISGKNNIIFSDSIIQGEVVSGGKYTDLMGNAKKRGELIYLQANK